MTNPTADDARERLRGMALSLATGTGPLVEPSAFDAALDAYRDTLLADQTVEHHTVDGARYLCHADDHYCPKPADQTASELASLAVNAGRALADEKRHYEIACQENTQLRAVVARIGQMTDYWEQHLPEVIRTPAVVSALRAAMEPATSAGPLPLADQTALRDRIAADAVQRALGVLRVWRDERETGPEAARLLYEVGAALTDETAAVLPAPTDRAADLLPAWEAVYEPGNVSTYLIGYANDQDAATGMAEAWLRSQAEVTGRLEWVDDEQMATGRYDRWFELIERHDDGVDTGPGIVVRRRLADEQSPAETQPPTDDAQAAAALAPLEAAVRRHREQQRIKHHVAVLREAADDLATAFSDPTAKHIGALGASHLRRRAREIDAELRRLADETQPADTPAVPPQCTAGLLPATSEPVDRCIRRGTHDSHVTASGARWGNGSADDEPAAGARQGGAGSSAPPA
jgi:hypothetical protein